MFYRYGYLLGMLKRLFCFYLEEFPTNASTVPSLKEFIVVCACLLLISRIGISVDFYFLFLKSFHRWSIHIIFVLLFNYMLLREK